MILSFLAGNASSTQPPEQLTIDPEPQTIPYTPGLTQPYNAPVPMVTPTWGSYNDGMVHPSVVDFGPGETWNGHRYWMAGTEYEAGSYGDKGPENPHIWHSDDAFNWEWPTGLQNPISWPAVQSPVAGAAFNSDTELVYDETTDRLWCFWREVVESLPKAERFWRSWSTDGSTWSTAALSHELVAPTTSIESPTIAKALDGTWKAWTFGNVQDKMWSLASIDGAWTEVGNVTGNGAMWHGSVIRIDSVWYMLGSGPTGTGTEIWGATSTNGLTWSKGANMILVGYGGWDDFMLYRPCMQPHPDGVNMRVWYSSNSTTIGWHGGYTIVPLSRWPTPA